MLITAYTEAAKAFQCVQYCSYGPEKMPYFREMRAELLAPTVCVGKINLQYKQFSCCYILP
jgi:hypothetical protein